MVSAAQRRVLGLLAALIGAAIAATVIVPILLKSWLSLGWRKPVADWLVGRGWETIAGCWGMVWVSIPEWSVAFFVGASVYTLSRCRPRAYLTAACLGFLVIPHIFCLLLLQQHPWSAYDSNARVLFLVALTEVGSAVGVFAGGGCAALVGRRRAGGRECRAK